MAAAKRVAAAAAGAAPRLGGGGGPGARQQHRIFHALHGGHGAEAAAGIHDRRVHLDGGAVQAQHRPGAGVEAAVVFHHGHGRDGGVQRVAADAQLFHGAFGRAFAAVAVLVRAARAAVHDDRISSLGDAHLVIYSIESCAKP